MAQRRRYLFPYPMRSMRFNFAFAPFAFWWRPTFTKPSLTEFAKEQGETQWWARWLWFQVSYGRML